MSIVRTFSELALLGSEWVLWLLLALSVVSVAVMVERAIFFARIKIDFATFRTRMQGYLAENDLKALRADCVESPSVETRALLTALDASSKGPDAMEKSVEGFLKSEKQQLDRGLIVLGTLGNNAPFIGLFGTVIGIIVAFHELSLNTTGGAGASAVMAGISEALVATAVGLLVAIPAVISFNIFNRLVRKKIANAESAAKTLEAYFSK